MTEAASSGLELRPFSIRILDVQLDELRHRLADVRLPAGDLRELVDYWSTRYDWRKYEARLNELPQYMTSIDGQVLHVVHVRSPEPEATPLLLIHGSPGSFVEFLAVIGPLTDPRMDGADPADAFDVVIPSTPGHGFSVPLDGQGWTEAHIARAFVELMVRLGYHRYGVHAGDRCEFGDLVGRTAPNHLIGVHVYAPVTGAPGSAERHLMRTDEPGGSPVDLLARIVDGSGGVVADRDHLLTDVSVCWFTRTAGSSAQLPDRRDAPVPAVAMNAPELLVEDVRTFFRNRG